MKNIWWVICVISWILLFSFFVGFCTTNINNEDEALKCSSLKAQGAPAYLAKGKYSDKCIVIGETKNDKSSKFRPFPEFFGPPPGQACRRPATDAAKRRQRL